MKINKLALVAAFLLLPASFAEAQSLEDEMACTPDVYRLCASVVPDEEKIVACLERNKRVLSSACRQVFSRPASKTQPDDQ